MAGITLKRALVGFAGAIVVGVVMGTLLGTRRLVRRLVEPVFIFGYPIPKISLHPAFTFVFGFGDWSNIVRVFLERLYPITLQTLAGQRNTDRVLVWAAQNAGASKVDTFLKVLVPSAAPAIFAGVRIALPVSLTVAIITEIIGESRGLGYVVPFASASFEPARAMAAFAVIAIIGFVFDRGLSAVRARALLGAKRRSSRSRCVRSSLKSKRAARLRLRWPRRRVPAPATMPIYVIESGPALRLVSGSPAERGP